MASSATPTSQPGGGRASAPSVGAEADSGNGEDALLRGDRVPDFVLPAADGRAFLFYEFAAGRPVLIASCADAWNRDTVEALASALADSVERLAVQAVLLCDRPPDKHADTPGFVALVDEAARLRQHLFGGAANDTAGVLAITDANLRLMDGCILAEPAGAAELAGLVNGIVEAARSEATEEQATSAAPVLIVPRVLPPGLCSDLIDGFERWSPVDSPMPAADGSGLAVDQDRKTRRDALIEDAELEQELIACVARRVLPEVHKAFCYRAECFERPKLVCYDAATAGHFDAHRDNTAPNTRHRRFALTLNLNTGSYEGGELMFPEYGTGSRYAPPAGGAIVFACSHAHRVAPVSAGRRYAVVSFMVEGPPSERPETGT